MNGKQIFKISGACVVAGITVVSIWYFFLRGGGLGKLSEDDANTLLKDNSKAKPDDEKITGVEFFKYIKKFLETIEDAVISACCATIEGSGKLVSSAKRAAIMKGAVEEAKKILFEGKKETIVELLGKDVSSDILKSDELKEEAKAKVALGKALVCNILKTKQDYKDAKYIAFSESLKEDDYSKIIKGHTDKVEKDNKGFKVSAGDDFKSQDMSLLLYSEIFFTAASLTGNELIEAKTEAEAVKATEEEYKEKERKMKKDSALKEEEEKKKFATQRDTQNAKSGDNTKALATIDDNEKAAVKKITDQLETDLKKLKTDQENTIAKVKDEFKKK